MLRILTALALLASLDASRAGADAVTGRSDHWAFQPVRRPTPPGEGAEAASNPIDQFIRAKLQQEGIHAAPPADPATLLRRLTLDLTGMPPKWSDVETFVADPSEEAYGRAVDRLLADPHYGEQWGRHWLDVARYADSAGYEFDGKRDVWKYRDWVIQALNADKPYDQFLREQIAGDLLPSATVDQKIATGFSCNALKQYGDVQDTTIDRVNAFGTAVLGLTLGCARCHDHKFDPISQTEYFQIYAFFDQAEDTVLDLSSPEVAGTRNALTQQIAFLKKELFIYQNGPDKDPLAWAAQLSPDELRATPSDLREAIVRVSGDRTPEQLERIRKGHELAVALYRDALETRLEAWANGLSPELQQQVGSELAAYLARPRAERMGSRPPGLMNKFWEQDAGRIERAKVIESLEKRMPESVAAEVMRQRIDNPETHVFLRGDPRNLGPKVDPGVPAVISLPGVIGPKPTRRDLAEWSVSPQNPLTARVEVNRIWQAFFGVGLVEAADNFGTQTVKPQYAQLLDWLAAELMEHGWSIKHIQRLIVTSAAYRQRSHDRQDLHAIDPQNHLFARQMRLRLDAENIRDAALSTSGLLNPTIGGPSVFPYQPDGVMTGRADSMQWKMSEGADRYRRGLYTHFWRLTPHPFLSLFDVPDASESCPRRTRSNTPIQALTLLNDPWFMEAAVSLARRIVTDAPTGDDGQRLDWAVKECLSRPASTEEIDVLKNLLAEQQRVLEQDPQRARRIAGEAGDDSRALAVASWTSVARALLNLDEFITRE